MRSHPLLLPVLATLVLSACPAKDDGADTTAAAGTAGGTSCVEGGGAPTITAAGVGPLRIGARVSDVAQRCTVRDTSFTLGEGMTENGRVVNLGGASAVLMVSDDAQPTIERVIITDSSIRTEDGLGIGKTVGAMRAAYGRVCAMRGEGNLVLAVPSLPGVSFQITDLGAKTVDVERQPESIPDNAAITRIWVYAGRVPCGGS